MDSRRSSIVVLVVVAIITVACIIGISRLHFSYDFEAFFPKNDPETEFYLNFRSQFETDNDFFIIALENESGMYDSTFLKHVHQLTLELQQIKNVTEVAGPTTIKEYLQDPVLGQLFELPLLRYDEPWNYSTDSLRIAQTAGVEGLFFGTDGKSVAINLKHEQFLSKQKCDVLADEIVAAVNQHPFDHTHVIGRALGQKLYVKLMATELIMFISLSLILTVLFLFIAFRSFWGIVIPTLVVFISILWTLGFIFVIGKELDLMLTVLPTILFVVGISDSVHVLSKYLQELRAGTDKRQAVWKAFKSIRLATFLTSVTTAIGFMTLMMSNIQPISDFGLYTSVGVLLAYGLTYAILPAILLLAKPKRLYDFAAKEDFWSSRLHHLLRWVFRRRRLIWPATVVIVGVSIWGITRIEVDNVMLEDLRDSHLLKREFKYMEQNFSGCRPFEMAVTPAPGVDIFSPQFLKDLDTIGVFLKNEYKVGSLFSLSEAVKTIHKSLNTGDVAYYTIPEDEQTLRSIKKLLKRKDAQELTALLFNAESGVVRVTGKVPDVGRKHYEALNQDLAKFISDNTTSKFEHHVTGTAHLIDVNNGYMVDNLLFNLSLSIGVIALIMSLVYGSWRMIFITIIPNVIPLLMIGGIMGFTDTPLKVSTSIIFNIAFGIAVDDTIHFLAQVRVLLLKPISVATAVKRAFLTTGKAMVVTTLILSGGFLTLILSDFLGTYYIGFLISLTLFLALLVELVVTPLVIVAFYKHRPKKAF